jgi:very-short-patch-repair endonuclease
MSTSNTKIIDLLKSMNEQFPHNIELLIELGVYSRKQQIKDKLNQYFILDTDYKIQKSLILHNNTKAMQAGKNKEDIIVTTNCFKSICLLSNTRSIISYKTKNELKNKFNIILDTKIRFIPIETETILYIMKVFKNEIMNTQYIVGKYRIDLYFNYYTLSIECNENNHNHYNQDDEIKRKKYIENKLKCSFITYNPDEKDFCVFNVINLIYEHIKKCISN